jgi:hypothetical protein
VLTVSGTRGLLPAGATESYATARILKTSDISEDDDWPSKTFFVFCGIYCIIVSS